MSKIGISNLHYAKQTTEETASSAATYGTVVAVPGTISADITPASNTAVLFADNGPYESAASLGEVNVQLTTADMPLSVLADLLGHTLDEQTGQLDFKASDTAPYVALMFEFLLGNGQKRCVKLYKGKFAEPGDNATTKGENVEFQTYDISGSFVQLKNNGMWKSVKDFAANADTSAWYTLT